MIIGVLGAGQLGRMLALAGLPLGMRFRFFSTTADACARDVGEVVVGSSWEDESALERFALGVEVVTYEFENVPVGAVEIVSRHAPVLPSARALALAQDRVEEKSFFRSLGVGTPEFSAVSTRAELDAAALELGYPFVLKTRRMGYDGKGQRVVRGATELDAAWGALGSGAAGLIAEAFVKFARELSVIGVRGRDGETAVYPVTENVHREGILRSSVAPAPGLSDAAEKSARAIVTGAMEALGYVGVLAVELFEVNGGLLVNEMACRVHNSGHWTMDGAETSQFENHLRAVAGLPLGGVGMRPGVARAGMVNLIGDHPALGAMLGVEGARVHLYGKEPKPGRKVGHVNFAAGDDAALRAAMGAMERLIRGG